MTLRAGLTIWRKKWNQKKAPAAMRQCLTFLNLIVTDEYVDDTIARLRRRWRIREMSIYDCKKNALSPEQEYAIIEIDKQQERQGR